MTRAEQIFKLKRRYHELTQKRCWKAANVVHIQLSQLVTKQLKWESRNTRNI